MRTVLVSLLCCWIAAMPSVASDGAAPVSSPIKAARLASGTDAKVGGASPAKAAVKTPPHEIVIFGEKVRFENAASVSFQIDIRNLGEKKLAAPDFYWGLAVVWDGKRYARDPKHIGIWNGPAEILPRTTWRSSFSLSEYQVSLKALTDGRHTIALESDTAKSNTLVVFVGATK